MDKLPKLGWKKSITIANKREKKGNKKRCLYSAYLGPGITGALHILAHLSSKFYDINTFITSFLLMRTLEQKNEKKCVHKNPKQVRPRLGFKLKLSDSRVQVLNTTWPTMIQCVTSTDWMTPLVDYCP